MCASCARCGVSRVRPEVVLGDSRETVPAFALLFPAEKCDLVFVDGGHSHAEAAADLANLAGLARGQGTVVLVDDTEQGGNLYTRLSR